MARFMLACTTTAHNVPPNAEHASDKFSSLQRWNLNRSGGKCELVPTANRLMSQSIRINQSHRQTSKGPRRDLAGIEIRSIGLDISKIVARQKQPEKALELEIVHPTKTPHVYTQASRASDLRL